MKVIFTEDGVSYFTSQQKKVSRFHLSDGLDEYGIQVVDFSPATIQRLQLMGYISKFELPVNDIVHKRKEFIDLIKLLTYGMLYRQYDTVVFDNMVESELIKNWNRHNVKNPIDHKTKINPQVLAGVLSKNAEKIEEIKKQILEPIHRRIHGSELLQDSEKIIHTFLSSKFIDNLNTLVFFILTVHQGSTSYFQLIRVIQLKLTSYMERSSIPEYLALMMVELLMNVKMSNDANVVPSQYVKNDDDEIFVLCRISRKKMESGDRSRLHFMISNKRSGFEDLKQKINNRITTAIGSRTLKDFYDSNSEMQENMHLGLYYLSYLSEACKKVNIGFESFVNKGDKDSATVIHLILTF